MSELCSHTVGTPVYPSVRLSLQADVPQKHSRLHRLSKSQWEGGQFREPHPPVVYENMSVIYVADFIFAETIDGEHTESNN
jgi:hypothetical protein